MDKTAVVIVLIIIVLGVGFFVWQYKPASQTPVEPAPLPEGIILFYGDGCSYCEAVDEFISQNNIEDKLKITRLEVWYDKPNAALLGQIAQQCGITGDSVGVPFLYDPYSSEAGGNGSCYVGEVDVPNFLKTQAGIQ